MGHLKTDMVDYKQLAAKSKRYVWHPFTQMKEYVEDAPLIIASGERKYRHDFKPSAGCGPDRSKGILSDVEHYIDWGQLLTKLL